MKSKKTIGFYFVIIASVLTAAGLYLYPSVYSRDPMASKLLMASLIAGAVTILAALVIGKEFSNFLVIAFTVLLMVAVGFSIAPMVTPIALWYAGLYDLNTVHSYFIFGGVALAAWLLALISSFTGVVKKA